MMVRLLLGVTAASSLGALAACGGSSPASPSTAPAAASGAPKVSAAASAAPVSKSAAGQAKSLEPVGVRLSWLGNGEYAVLYVAKAKGFYEAQGIDLAIHEGGPGKNPIVFVAAGKDDMFGVAPGDNLIRARAAEHPIDVTALGALLQVNPLAYIRLAKAGSPQPTAQDLVGKRVGVQPNSGFYVRALAKKNNIDPASITIVNVGATPEMLLLGKIDFFAGWITNQAWDIAANLKKAGRTGDTWQGLLYNKWGIPFYADCLFCTGQTLKQKPDLVRRFLAATAKGAEYLYQHPQESIPLVRKYATIDSATKLEWRFKQQNPLMVSADTKQHGLLWTDSGLWQREIDFLHTYGQIASKPAVGQVASIADFPPTPKM
ncbi:MAG: ABC transporter substrate-binding protein [Chloroflexota bacterium]